jgi:hypothetical protein
MQTVSMARLDWDRLRRYQPLDGADPRVDPDGAILWEREVGAARDADTRSARERLEASSGIRRLREGIVVRRARERRLDEAGQGSGGAEVHEPAAGSRPTAHPTPRQPRAVSAFDPNAWLECPRCKARVPRRKLLLHARAACTRRE